MIPKRQPLETPTMIEVQPKRRGRKPRNLNPMAKVFDIETIAQDEERLLAMAPVFEAKANLKDPEKIAADIEEKKRKYIELAALDWKTANIALIVVTDGKEFLPITGTETEILVNFFGIATHSMKENSPLGGHCVYDFDWPMIINRARVLSVPIPPKLVGFRGGRPFFNDCLFDTMPMIAFGTSMDLKRGNGVDDIARAIGIPGKTADGSQFGSMWKNNRDEAIAYCVNDCRIEVEIARRCGFRFNV